MDIDMDIELGWDMEFENLFPEENKNYIPLPRSQVITTEEVDRWRCHVEALPLPEEFTPFEGIPLNEVDDDALLTAPPHMLVHMQRTAAQGGLQVVSPRQIPFTCLMTRTKKAERSLGDHVVGSIARQGIEWPTIDGASFDRLLPDQPLPQSSAKEHLRTKTHTEPLTRAGRLLTDPVLNCLVKGRAVIDVLRRPDVCGDAETFAKHIAEAWGMSKEEMDDMDAFTLGNMGSMLRHSIKADDVYPMLHAPIHVKRSIGMGVSQVSREVLPEDSAMDWRRMRVFTEAVFCLATSIEGIPLARITASPPPGDPSAAGNRRNIMVFQPAPATAWTHSPKTFAIDPTDDIILQRGMGVPTDVLRALARYRDVVRPLTLAKEAGHRAVAVRSIAYETAHPEGETITSGFHIVTRKVLTGSVRGKTAAATVRNTIFRAIENAPLPVRMRIARYMRIAKEEVKTHLGDDIIPDLVIDKIAVRFLTIGELIRMEVVAEAARRGATTTEWWFDIITQSPLRYQGMLEGTMGWTKVGFWLMFRAPTDNWERLIGAVHYSATREAAKGSVASMALPPRLGSADRVEAVARATIKRVSEVYAGYYMGVADVGLAISDEAELRGRHRTAAILREGAYLWMLRARAIRGTNVRTLAKEEACRSPLHRRILCEESDLALVPSPYRAFRAYFTHIAGSHLIPTDFKKWINKYNQPDLSGIFTEYRRILVATPESKITRYLVRPWELGNDMERAWNELVGDVRNNVKEHALSKEIVMTQVLPTIAREVIIIENTPTETVEKDYFALIGDMDYDTVEWIESVLDRMDEVSSEAIYCGHFSGPDELLAKLRDQEVILSLGKEARPETIR